MKRPEGGGSGRTNRGGRNPISGEEGKKGEKLNGCKDVVRSIRRMHVVLRKEKYADKFRGKV